MSKPRRGNKIEQAFFAPVVKMKQHLSAQREQKYQGKRAT